MAIGSFALRNLTDLSREDGHVASHRDPIRAIVADTRQRGISADQVVLLFDSEGQPGLIQWGWCVRAYSDFVLARAKMLVRSVPLSSELGTLTYYISSRGERPDVLATGFERMEFPSAAGERAPRVYVFVRKSPF